MPLVFFRDSFVEESAALIPVATHALHYGTAVFEGIRSYGDGARASLFRPHEHYARFHRNAAWLAITPRWSVDELVALTVELLQRNRFYDNRYIRPILYKNTTTTGAGLPEGEDLAILAMPSPHTLESRTPVTATFSRWRRFPNDCCPSGAKISGLYVNSSLARADALGRGFDQPILLTHDGDVSEGYGANIFVVKGRHVMTPPIEADILMGITRDTLLTYFRSKVDITVDEVMLTPEQLLGADEAFFCGTGMEILPIGSIDGAPLKAAPGPITSDVSRWYADTVTGRLPAPDGWLVSVPQRA